MRAYKTFAAAATILLLAGVLAGCSAARLGYSNGETLSYWWLNRYVGFEGEQKAWAKKEIAGLYAWHRKSQLPDYVEVLKLAQARVNAPVSEADLLNDYEAVKKRLLLLVDKAMPQLADLALSLQPHQIDNIEKKFASNNEDYRKDYLRGDVEKRQLFRFKKLRKQAEYWLGSFSEVQEEQLKKASDARLLNNELVLEDRMQRQQAMITLLRKIHAEKPSHAATMRMLKDYSDRALDRFGNAEHKSFFKTSREQSARMVAGMVNRATPEQRAHFIQSTQQWINDFNALSM